MMRRSRLLKRIVLGMLLGLAAGVVISEATYFFLRDGQQRPPEVIVLSIPPGTADQVAGGKSVPSLPTSMTFVVGDTLLVRNHDLAAHELGPLLVPPGGSASLKLEYAQDFEATCSFQPTRYLGLHVQSPLTVETRLIGILEAGLPMGFLFVLYGVFAMPLAREVGPE